MQKNKNISETVSGGSFGMRYRKALNGLERNNEKMSVRLNDHGHFCLLSQINLISILFWNIKIKSLTHVPMWTIIPLLVPVPTLLDVSLILNFEFVKLVLNICGKYTIEIVHLTFCNAHFGAVFLASLSPRIKFNGEMTKRQWSFWHSVLKQHSHILALLQSLTSEHIHQLPIVWLM